MGSYADAELFYGWKIPTTQKKQKWIEKNYCYEEDLPKPLEIGHIGDFCITNIAGVLGIKIKGKSANGDWLKIFDYDKINLKNLEEKLLEHEDLIEEICDVFPKVVKPQLILAAFVG